MRESEARLALAAVVEEELLAPDQIALELAVRAARPGATPVAPADGAVAALLHLVRGRLPRQLLEPFEKLLAALVARSLLGAEPLDEIRPRGAARAHTLGERRLGADALAEHLGELRGDLAQPRECGAHPADAAVELAEGLLGGGARLGEVGAVAQLHRAPLADELRAQALRFGRQNRHRRVSRRRPELIGSQTRAAGADRLPAEAEPFGCGLLALGRRRARLGLRLGGGGEVLHHVQQLQRVHLDLRLGDDELGDGELEVGACDGGRALAHGLAHGGRRRHGYRLQLDDALGRAAHRPAPRCRAPLRRWTHLAAPSHCVSRPHPTRAHVQLPVLGLERPVKVHIHPAATSGSTLELERANLDKDGAAVAPARCAQRAVARPRAAGRGLSPRDVPTGGSGGSGGDRLGRHVASEP